FARATRRSRRFISRPGPRRSTPCTVSPGGCGPQRTSRSWPVRPMALTSTPSSPRTKWEAARWAKTPRGRSCAAT
ncbi:MAG: hypothetical protein ACK56F_29815, partial [bacterium]